MITFDHAQFLKTLPSQPGVYQMFGNNHTILYVGKAKNLKKRVSSYFHKQTTNARIAGLLSQIVDIEVIITDTESAALLLENNLIKKLKPRYNVLFRDDKSYPYILLSDHKDFPRLDYYRGPKTLKGRYFGPYPSSAAVRESLNQLQKIFQIRQCSDPFFKSRTRPCIQYQIKRCTAPCVGYIDSERYMRNVRLAELFLEGKNQQVIQMLNKNMEAAATSLHFEEAARLRDQIAALRKIQERQYIYDENSNQVDVIACVRKTGVVCVNILFIRAGRLIGSHAHFPHAPPEISLEEAMAEFLPQYYLAASHAKDIPKEILMNSLPEEADWIFRVLSEQAQHKVIISKPHRGKRLQWLQMSLTNANNSLSAHLAGKLSFYNRFEALQQVLHLDNIPQRMECFDISHTFGEAIVAACVVFNVEGPLKNDYRRFNIEGITKGDDYAALYQALMRRYSHLKKIGDPLPDIIIIDGGKGQLHQAEKVLEELQISGLTLIGIAKGPMRKPGLETLFLSGQPHPFELAPDSMAFHLLQQIRDEAHRFAITGHKKQRDKRRVVSRLEFIAGIGPTRRRNLLQHFGGLQEISNATLEELTKVSGINPKLAKIIYESLHHDKG